MTWYTVWIRGDNAQWSRVSDYPTLQRARNAARKLSVGQENNAAFQVRVAPSDKDLTHLR